FWKVSDPKKFNELQDLLQQAREASGDDQQKLFGKCFDLIAEQVPLYPLMHRQVTSAWWPELLAGFKPVSTTGLYFLDAACTEKSAK
ncbi:MAG: ABC transporter substrate-binding protein, partial [Eggerthellales bacterium]|nr:ABC transporter substrate-binding protein [Eggerthellales bacterium]